MAGETLEIYGDGSATRDYIFTGDLVRAILAAAAAPGIGGEVFQIATNRETTVQEITEKLIAVLGEFGIGGVTVKHGEARRGDMPRNYSDTTKARERLGGRLKPGFRKGCDRRWRGSSRDVDNAPRQPAPGWRQVAALTITIHMPWSLAFALSTPLVDCGLLPPALSIAARSHVAAAKKCNDCTQPVVLTRRAGLVDAGGATTCAMQSRDQAKC